MCKGGLANMCQDFALLSHIICFFPGNCQENAMGLRHRPLLNNSQDLLSIFSQQELEQVSSNIAYRSVCPRRLQWWWWPDGGGGSTGTAVWSRGPMAATPVSSTSPPHTGLYTGDITLGWYSYIWWYLCFIGLGCFNLVTGNCVQTFLLSFTITVYLCTDHLLFLWIPP